VLAHGRRAIRRVRIRAGTQAELVIVDEEHPLLDRLVDAVDDVRGDVPADGVARAERAVRVELAAGVVEVDVQLREVACTHDLDVGIGLDEGHAGDGAVGDDAGVIARLRAPGDLDGLSTEEAQ
jgi:hypothetical protein